MHTDRPEDSTGAELIRSEHLDDALDIPDPLVESVKDSMEDDVFGP